MRHLVIISPWITSPPGESSFSALLDLIRAKRITTYVVTRSPASTAHLDCVERLSSCPSVEVIFNDNVHAKVLVCIAPSPHAFALIGSANMTVNSESLYEIGVLIVGEGTGSQIVHQLGDFGTSHLRTRPESKVYKKIVVRR